MGIFKEYLTMAANGMKNISNVAEGNLNRLKDGLGLLPQDEQDEADRRYNICYNCPFMSKNASAIGFYDTSRPDQHCSVCKCPIEAKVLAFNDSCGMNILEVQYDGNGNKIGGIEGYKRLWDVYVKTNEDKSK